MRRCRRRSKVSVVFVEAVKRAEAAFRKAGGTLSRPKPKDKDKSAKKLSVNTPDKEATKEATPPKQTPSAGSGLAEEGSARGHRGTEPPPPAEHAPLAEHCPAPA
eukprot:8175329-Pyramimonas_sp.AAC.1